MENKFMNQESIIDLLESQGLDPIAKGDTSSLIISEKIIRCEAGDTLIAGMGSNKGKDDQIHLVVDAVHLCLQAKCEKKFLRLIFGRRKNENEQAEVENAVALMIENIKIPLKIETEVDGEKIEFKSESLNEDDNCRIERWISDLIEERNVPKFAKDLENAIGNDMFKWYRSVTGTYWSGRVAGLEVCRVDRNLAVEWGELKVGSPGKYGNGQARNVFHKIIKEKVEEGFFPREQIEIVSSVIREIAESRGNKNGELAKFQREHLLESYVLSGKVEIISQAGVLRPALGDYPFQFPTLWGPKGAPRFVDALMRCGDVPYVVELKEPSGFSRGQGYRHAITQAVLYREFVRRAEKVQPWFINKGLAPDKCRAIVAFPELPKGDKKKQMLLNQHMLVGNAFGVEIIEIKGFE